MNNNIDIIDAYDIQHLPDARGDLNSPGFSAIGAYMSQQDLPEIDWPVIAGIAGASIIINIIFLITIIILLLTR